MYDEFNFDSLEEIRIPVSIEGQKYVLKEADGEAAVLYRNATMKSFKLGSEGKPQSIDGLAEAEPLLVSKCLFKLVENRDTGEIKEAAVSLVWVKKLKNRILKPLFEKAQEISGLKDDSAERRALVEALKRDDAPISLRDFREWAAALETEDKKTFGPLHALVKADAEEEAKNSHVGTTDGSE